MAGLERTDCIGGLAVPEARVLDRTPGATELSKYLKLESDLKIATQCMEKVQEWTSPRETSNALKFNKKQCEYLANKLKRTVESASSFVHSISQSDVSREVLACEGNFKLLVAKAKESESFVEACCETAWIEAAITLTKVPQHISSICFNLELSRLVFEGVPLSRTLTELEIENMIEKINEDEVCLAKELASQDEKELLEKMEEQLKGKELKSLKGQERELARCLLGKLKSTSTEYYLEQFRRIIVPAQYLEFVRPVGKGGYGHVHEMKWSGIKVAMKVFNYNNNPFFDKEVTALMGLFHANVIPLFFCCTYERQSICMELMENDLATHIWSIRGLQLIVPFSSFVMVDIIGEGMHYLHSKNIVHRGLKPDNVLVKVVDKENGYVHVKLADFGRAKTLESSISIQTCNVGTNRYMAPEVIHFHDQESGANVLFGRRKYYDPKKAMCIVLVWCVSTC